MRIIVTIKSKDVISIICKTLNKVDERLVNHGERVAYVIYKMLKYEGGFSKAFMDRVGLLAVMHDIGAYKTDEIDRLVEFETKNVWQHSVYGSLFLKKLSPLAEFSDIVLYHHLPYDKFDKIECKYKQIAMMFSFVDRLDIYMQNNNFMVEQREGAVFKGSAFSPDVLELFYAANNEYGIINNLKNGSYLTEITEYIESCEFTEDEINAYLKMLAVVIDFRSEATVLHTIMTVNISLELVDFMNIDEYGRRAVYYGALLHDIGKISTPLSILENPGRLTNEEMQVMKLHVSVSEEILRPYINSEICDIAVRHHEKLDGSGYPYGLKADKLTPCQRAVAVADILSALTGVRSYKNGYSKERTVGIIKGMAENNKISRDIADIVLVHYDEIMKNAEARSKKIRDIYSSISEEYEPLFVKCMAL
ncbi:MAG: HD domain-containing protein [Hydrogenoanaerobacterium sp.]